jgi:hypothetical protein
VHIHDGFYARVGTGLGGYLEMVGPTSMPIAARVSGASSAIELALAGTLVPGFALGLGVYIERLLSTDVQLADARSAPLPQPLEPSFRATTLVGPHADWYFDPQSGLHGQAAAGLFHISRAGYTPGSFDAGDYSATGVGVLLGLGQEWWMSQQSSIGVTTQFGLGWAEGESQGEQWTHWIIATPIFMFTWTYH